MIIALKTKIIIVNKLVDGVVFKEIKITTTIIISVRVIKMHLCFRNNVWGEGGPIYEIEFSVCI